MYNYSAMLVRVIDGDTVVLDIDIGFRMWRRAESYRLVRINAPEMTTPDGHKAKAALESQIPKDSPFLIQTSKSDKYGRYLVDILVNGNNVNDWMVTNKFAVPYMLRSFEAFEGPQPQPKFGSL